MTSQLMTNDSPAEPVVFDAGEGGKLVFQAQDEQDPPQDIDANDLETLTFTLTDDSGTVINSRNAIDILGANIGTIVGTTVEVRLQPADNAFVGAGIAYRNERHHAIFKWTWNDGVETRTGKASYYFHVTNVP